MINIHDIVKARDNISKVVNKTPFALASILSEKLGVDVYLKKENLQVTGAYKIRGAFNKIASLSVQEKQNGVVAASAGNHAQGVAYAARSFGVKATIVMPETTPLLKVVGTKELGASVILKGGNYDEAYKFSLEYAKQHNATFIHPFEDDKIIAGQGTIALEIFEDIKELDAIIIPVGGGGLISGIGSAIKQLYPHIKVIGVSASGASAMHDSFHTNTRQDTTSVKTIADGIAVKNASQKTFNIIQDVVDELVQVDDEEIANAILFLLERQKLVVEGGGAVGVAALMHEKLKLKPKSKVAVILSGGNIDVNMLSIIIEKGLIKSKRKMKLIVTLVDKPGSLMRLTEILQELDANIIQIDYDRTSTTLSFGDANVTLALDTKGEEHQEKIRNKLNENGYRFQEEF
jgi:threonine dehydratase